MLLETAIGDAYGAGFEYADISHIRSRNNLQYTTHPNVKSINVDLFRMGEEVIHPRQVHGRYTDDTQMSIAVAEVILSGNEWTKEALADSFVNCFKRDQRTGYAGGFYRFLCEIKDGQEFLARIRPHSDKSGAAMRAAPVGIYPTVDQVIKKCTLQASLTHDTPDGIASANAVAVTTHYFIYEIGDKKDLARYLDKYIPGQWTSWKGKVGSKGWMSVRAAITAITKNDRLSDLLKDCINFSGDVDTVAAIAMAAASCCKEIENDIPQNLIDELENGPYGRDYIIDLDKKLMALVDRIKARKRWV